MLDPPPIQLGFMCVRNIEQGLAGFGNAVPKRLNKIKTFSDR